MAKFLSYNFYQVLLGHLVITTSKIWEVTDGGKQGGEGKTPMHVLEGDEAKETQASICLSWAAQRPFPVLLETFGYLH